MSTKDDLLTLAEELISVGGGRLRLAFNEDDESTAKVADAAHFLKLDEQRLGRDIELYGFLAKIAGDEQMLPDFVAGVVLPLRLTVPIAYNIAVAKMVAWGRNIYPESMIAEWEAIFAESEAACQS